MLTVTNLQMCYNNDIVALKEINLVFEKSRFTVLLGTSGAGKSTLLRCLNLLNVPTAGEISAEGIGVIRNTSKCLRLHRKQTAMIFQQHQLIDRQTVLTNVLLGCMGSYTTFRSLFPLRRSDKHFALECLERVGLLDKALVRVDNLSGGQQQRVGIARALAQRPKLILADEPVASLDPETSKRVLSILHRIAREDNISVIVSLHQVELARRFADRVIGLSDGSVVFDGSAEELTERNLRQIYTPLSNTDRAQVKSQEYSCRAGLAQPVVSA